MKGLNSGFEKNLPSVKVLINILQIQKTLRIMLVFSLQYVVHTFRIYLFVVLHNDTKSRIDFFYYHLYILLYFQVYNGAPEIRV